MQDKEMLVDGHQRQEINRGKVEVIIQLILPDLQVLESHLVLQNLLVLQKNN